MKYKRILIKLSGEALSGDGKSGILDSKALLNTAQAIKDIHSLGVEVTIVIGAGNICRGSIAENKGIVVSYTTIGSYTTIKLKKNFLTSQLKISNTCLLMSLIIILKNIFSKQLLLI